VAARGGTLLKQVVPAGTTSRCAAGRAHRRAGEAVENGKPARPDTGGQPPAQPSPDEPSCLVSATPPARAEAASPRRPLRRALRSRRGAGRGRPGQGFAVARRIRPNGVSTSARSRVRGPRVESSSGTSKARPRLLRRPAPRAAPAAPPRWPVLECRPTPPMGRPIATCRSPSSARRSPGDWYSPSARFPPSTSQPRWTWNGLGRARGAQGAGRGPKVSFNKHHHQGRRPPRCGSIPLKPVGRTTNPYWTRSTSAWPWPSRTASSPGHSQRRPQVAAPDPTEAHDLPAGAASGAWRPGIHRRAPSRSPTWHAGHR